MNRFRWGSFGKRAVFFALFFVALGFTAAHAHAAVLYIQPVHDTAATIRVSSFSNYPTQKNVITNAPAGAVIKGISIFASENYCGGISLFDTTMGNFLSPLLQQGPNSSSNPRELLYTRPDGVALTAGHSYDLILGCNAVDGDTWNGAKLDAYGGADSLAGNSRLGSNFNPRTDVADYSFAICDTIDCPLKAPPDHNPVIIIPGILGSSDKDGVWVIDPIFHVYDDLIATLEANGYAKGQDLFTMPYDWRQSNVLTALQLRDKLNEVKSVCQCAKVDLVAHSMGGLVARQYIQSDKYQNDIDHLIFLGTPHLGSPEAYLTWEGGEIGTGNGENFLLKTILSREAKKAGFTNLFDYVRNKPILSLHELLPIYNYLRDKSSGDLRIYSNNYPSNLFLENINTNSPNLLSKNIKITNIVGDLGPNSTINVIRVVNLLALSPLWVNGYPEGFDGSTFDRGLESGPGDGTVPNNSANFINQDLSIISAKHRALPTKAENLIIKKLTNKDASILFDHGLWVNPKLLFIKILSPVDIEVVAPDGKRIGKNFETDTEINEIDGAFYSGFKTDDEYVTIPDPLDGEYKIITQGTDTGSYTVATGYISDNVLVDKDFTAETRPGLTEDLSLNVNNTNPEMLEIKPKDTTPPSILVISPEAKDYLHSETLSVNINISDIESGVLSSTVSLDGTPFVGFSIDLFSQKLGNHSLYIQAADFVGNTASTTVQFRVIATLQSTISDIERAYALGWITKKSVKDGLVRKLQNIDTHNRPLTQKTLKTFLAELEREHPKNINDQAYTIIKDDINWLLNN